MIDERSVADLLRDIVQDVQEIVRSEVRLAKTEIREEASKAQSAGLLTGAGAVASMYGVLFLLLMLVYALSTVMPNWAAALIVGGVLAILGGVTLGAGLKRFKQIHPAPERDG